ncbi:MAG TPA: RNA polymerase sigma factor [Ktedonobacterales bacterium]|nr:RNA polymerase sigma factor [Ktedonobacterales bacterium]
MVSRLAADEIGRALGAERERLVRLCLRMTGSYDAAEDLAQQTLLEAWRLLDRLRDSDGLSAWLTAIARNVCHRWLRAQGRERAQLTIVAHEQTSDRETSSLYDTLTDEASDPLVQVERSEMAALVSRALAALPETTRALTIASATQATSDLASAFGLSEGAVRVRLHRGRQALRRALSVDLRRDAEAFDLALPPAPEWRDTRIWCPFCGAHHLRVRVNRETGEYAVHCAGACDGRAVAGRAVSLELTQQVRSPKSLITRHCLMLATAYRQALAGTQVWCDCGSLVTFRSWSSADTFPAGASFGSPYGIVGVCSNCGIVDSSTSWHLALDTVEAQRFWRRHPRMRVLPITPVERDNRPALITGFAAIDSVARLEIISDAHTYALLHVAVAGAL